MKKIVLFISVLLSTATVYAQQDDLIGGIRKELRGVYNNDLKAFFRDADSAYQRGYETDMFNDPTFIERYVEHVREETGNENITWDYIKKNGKKAPLPEGFRASMDATHVMSLWSPDGLTIEDWLARDPYLNGKENGIWVDGFCTASLYCLNLIRELQKRKAIQENQTKYTKANGSTAVPVITINNNNYGGNSTSSATGGSSSVSQPLTGGDDEVIFDDRPRRRSSGGYIDDGVFRTQEMQNTSQKAENWSRVILNGVVAYRLLKPATQKVQVITNNRGRRNSIYVYHRGRHGNPGGGTRTFNNEALNPPGGNNTGANGHVGQYNTSQPNSDIANNYGNRRVIANQRQQLVRTDNNRRVLVNQRQQVLRANSRPRDYNNRTL